jgi:lipoprotein-releasing system ATP-binding protein
MSKETPIIEARGLTRIIDGEVPTTLVDDINFRVEHGEFLAVTGPSGGGKSSLLYLLGLIDRPTRGTVLIDGRDTASLSSDELAEVRLSTLGFVFQFHFLLEEFSALENVTMPMKKLARLSEEAQQAKGAELLKQFDLASHLHKKPHQLSGGQRQRVAIARALANSPQLILADEPTGNLDTRNADVVFAAFREIVTSFGASVMVVTHDMDLAARADRRLHIVDGHLTPV